MNENYKVSELEEIFSSKLTENGDVTRNTTGNRLSDLIFMSEYFQNHLSEVNIGTSEYEKIFAMFMRDPRFGLGRRDLGRVLMRQAECWPIQITTAGRWDDISYIFNAKTAAALFKEAIENGNELAKKWAPRYSSKNVELARLFAKEWHMNKQDYGKFVKCNTVENKLSRHNISEIDFSKIPSLALLKYWNRFSTGKDTKDRFEQWKNLVQKGESKMNISTTTVYDIYRNRSKIDADLVYSQMEKISGNWLPIIDVSGSMFDCNDSIGKALSIGKYLSDTSTYCPNSFVTFSSYPELVKQSGDTYNSKIFNMTRANWDGSTDLGAVMRLLKNLKTEVPEYLVILSDMEFNAGSSQSKDALMRYFKENHWNTKIIWWNFNSRNTTSPESDKDGNIFLSGYNPMLLKYLESGFDNDKFVDALICEYAKNIKKAIEK